MWCIFFYKDWVLYELLSHFSIREILPILWRYPNAGQFCNILRKVYAWKYFPECCNLFCLFMHFTLILQVRHCVLKLGIQTNVKVWIGAQSKNFIIHSWSLQIQHWHLLSCVVINWDDCAPCILYLITSFLVTYMTMSCTVGINS